MEKIETEKKNKAEEAAKKERMESLKNVAKTEEIVKKTFKLIFFFQEIIQIFFFKGLVKTIIRNSRLSREI